MVGLKYEDVNIYNRTDFVNEEKYEKAKIILINIEKKQICNFYASPFRMIIIIIIRESRWDTGKPGESARSLLKMSIVQMVI